MDEKMHVKLVLKLKKANSRRL